MTLDANAIICFACACMREEMGVPVIEYLAKRFPEKVAACIDGLGNNPPWYLLHNEYAAWWRPECGMAQALVKAGCDPDAVNHLGFSFRLIADSLTEEQRSSLEVRHGKILAKDKEP